LSVARAARPLARAFLAACLATAAACSSPVETQLEAASAEMRQGAYENALVIYDEVLERVPDAPNIHNNMGYALAQLGRYEEAVGHFQAARAQGGPRSLNATLLHNWANALEKMGSNAEAAEKYAEAAALDPTRADVFVNWGNTLVRLGRLEEAAERYATAVDNDPASAVGWFNRGYTLERLERVPEAVSCYRTFLTLKGGVPSNLHEHARRFVAQAEAAGMGGGTGL
jgi:tetratricopeptide (TPR) repeat protein